MKHNPYEEKGGSAQSMEDNPYEERGVNAQSICVDSQEDEYDDLDELKLV